MMVPKGWFFVHVMFFQHVLRSPSLKLTFSPLKMDDWNTILSYWVSPYFQVLLLMAEIPNSHRLDVWNPINNGKKLPALNWIFRRISAINSMWVSKCSSKKSLPKFLLQLTGWLPGNLDLTDFPEWVGGELSEDSLLRTGIIKWDPFFRGSNSANQHLPVGVPNKP